MADRPRSKLRLCFRLLIVGLALAGVSPSAPVQSAERRRIDARTGALEVPVEELATAVRRKDRAEIGRIAELVGPARLAMGLRRSDTATVLAALTGITALPGRVRLIGPVAELVGTADPPLAAAAARTLGEIMAVGVVPEFEDWEVPPDVIDSACAVLRSTATTAHKPTPLRLAAMDALADAVSVCAPTAELVGLLRDPTPAVRRAAALMLRPQQLLATGGFASGTRDIDKAVAAASVAAMCDLSVSPGFGKAGAREPIWEQTRQLARRLVVAAETLPEDAVQMMDCLDPTSGSDRQILDNLRARQRSPLAERAAEIVSQAQSRSRP